MYQTKSVRFQKAIDAIKSNELDLADEILNDLEGQIRSEGSIGSSSSFQLLSAILKYRDDFFDDSDSIHSRSANSNIEQTISSRTPGVSLVTCAMNLTKNLLHALPSWQAHKEIDEIIIIDWNSDIPVEESISQAKIQDQRIRIIRVLEEPRWILSYAFNLGFRCAKYDKILKADADIILKPDFFEKNKLNRRHFIAGDWRQAEKGQEFINGFFYVNTSELSEVNGFNEYITTYGWDDTDLYERLELNGTKRVLVDVSTINHIDHSDHQRISKYEEFDCAWDELLSNTQFNIQRNRYLNEIMPKWRNNFTFSYFEVIEKKQNNLVVRRCKENVPMFPNSSIEFDSYYYGAAAIVSWRAGLGTYHVPKDRFCYLLAKHKLEEISKELIEKNSESKKDIKTLPSPKSHFSYRPKIFVDAQHGLGNRLRAIGSAAAIARATDRDLAIVWEPDHHCEARFSDLFEYQGHLIENSFINEAKNDNYKVYNYMEIEKGAVKDEFVDLDFAGDLYLRSAYTFNSPMSDWGSENFFLRKLKPSQAVRDLISTLPDNFDLSIHIRMIGSAGTDTESYDRVDNWTMEGHKQINHWRTKSHYKFFQKRVNELIKHGAVDSIFIAADNSEAYDAFSSLYGDRVFFLKRNVYDRSTEQLKYALADAFLLGQAPLLLGSHWSSFTELARRLAKKEMEIEVSGKNF